jgi:hypothetical protein
MSDPKAIERAVLAYEARPCLYGVAGPCFHPKCLLARYNAMQELLRASSAAPKVKRIPQ